METKERYEDIKLTLYIPEPITLLLTVLSFLAGFLYRKYNDKSDLAEAFDEGFEKGAYALADAIEEATGKEIQVDFDSFYNKNKMD